MNEYEIAEVVNSCVCCCTDINLIDTSMDKGERQLFGSLVGEFVSDGFRGKEKLKMPDSMKGVLR